MVFNEASIIAILDNIDMIYTHEDFREERREVFADESAYALLSYVIPEMLNDDVTDDELLEYISQIITMFLITIMELKAQFQISNVDILRNIKILMGSDSELRESFTLDEALQFLKFLEDERLFSVLNSLDQITGIYLSLKSLERIVEHKLKEISQ